MWSRSLIPVLTISLLALPACAATPAAQTQPQSRSASPVSITPPARAALTQQERFNIWKSEFITESVTKGYNRAMVERLILPAKIEERALGG